jgi:hypothetical protein
MNICHPLLVTSIYKTCQSNYFSNYICNSTQMTRWHLTFKLLFQFKVYKFIY